MRTLITGATGLIGQALIASIKQSTPDASIVVLSRNPERAQSLLGVDAFGWNPATEPPPRAALEDVECVFNLAGEPVVDGRWTAERKRRIHDSRVTGTRNLVLGLESSRPRVMVSASAVGFYGDRGDEPLDESSSPGSDFLAEVCVGWERVAERAEALGIRVARIRIGVVLAPGGGALAKMLPIFRMGLGGPVGSGKQWMPWVHIDDVIGLMRRAASDDTPPPIINAVGPEPATNRTFTNALGRTLGRPTFMKVPTPALRLALGEMSNVLTASQRVHPTAAERIGYEYAYPTLDSALDDVIG